jgi:hypothetical protein
MIVLVLAYFTAAVGILRQIASGRKNHLNVADIRRSPKTIPHIPPTMVIILLRRKLSSVPDPPVITLDIRPLVSAKNLFRGKTSVLAITQIAPRLGD